MYFCYLSRVKLHEEFSTRKLEVIRKLEALELAIECLAPWHAAAARRASQYDLDLKSEVVESSHIFSKPASKTPRLSPS